MTAVDRGATHRAGGGSRRIGRRVHDRGVGVGSGNVSPSPLDPIAALPGVADAVESSRSSLDALLKHHALRRRRADVAVEASLRSARASAALDGVDLDLDWLRSGAVRADHAGAGVINGALRVSAELGTLAPVWRRSPLQALARLHLLAAADLAGEATLGRPRTAPDAADPYGLGAAPTPEAVAARLDLLSRTVLASFDVPALVVASVVHGELMVLRPFGSADGVVARAAARLVISAWGLDPDLLAPPEPGHLALGTRAYREALQGFGSGDADGIAAWVTHCGAALTRGADQVRTVCDTLA